MNAQTVLLLLPLIAACTAKEVPPAVLSCAHPEQKCSMKVNGHLLQIRFSETPKPLRPFNLEIQMEAESIEASFQMQGMEMGFNRYMLTPEGDKWRAGIILPACIQARSDWILRLNVKHWGSIHRYEVPFKSG